MNISVRKSPPETQTPSQPAKSHGWLMMVCCVPMLVIATLLVVTGVASVGFIFVALLCTAMMFLMMRMMGRGDSGM
jgi:drug/metabolite transporter (DMT)-like permease